MDKQLRLDVSEATLRRALLEAHEREMAALPSNDELAKIYPISATHERRMRKLFRRVRRNEIVSKVAHQAWRIAAVFIFGLLIFFGALMTNSQVRAAVRETIISWQDRFVSFRFRGGGAGASNIHWQLGIIPDGFEKDSGDIHASGGDIFFLHGDGRQLYFSYSRADQISVAISTDHTEMTIQHIGTVEYRIFIPHEGSDHPVSILWTTHEHVFLLSGQLHPDEVLQIALSVYIAEDAYP